MGAARILCAEWRMSAGREPRRMPGVAQADAAVPASGAHALPARSSLLIKNSPHELVMTECEGRIRTV